jgi:ferredoxin-type protein NapH
MRQKIRRVIIYLSLLFFPITLNFFSPYVSIDGALNGIISGSVIVFFIMFLSGIFFGRAWCAWVCPMAGLSDMTKNINDKTVNVKKLAILRYSIFAVWFSILITCFVLAGGIKGINPLHLTEHFVSVDEPMKYIVYYIVLFTFGGLSVWIGRRAACHGICWMSPFLVGGYLLGRALRTPQLRIKTEPAKCIDCKLCNKKCPMSIDVNGEVKKGEVVSLDCILCGECVDTCPKKVLGYKVR